MSAAHDTERSPRGSGISPLGQTGLRVLVVDDDPSVRQVVSKTLQEVGHEVVTASDGLEAWMLFDRDPFPMVVTDIMMPGIDGLELLKKIREIDPHVEVVLITGFGETRLVIEALRRGASNFIEKPFTPEGLLEQLAPSFHRCALARERERLAAEIEALREREERDRRMAALGRLLSGLAHEIHNPLTFIKGNAELLERYWDEAAAEIRKALGTEPQVLGEMRDLLGDLQHGVHRIESMVEAVKTLAGGGPRSSEDVRLRDLMYAAFRIALAKKPKEVAADFAFPPEDWIVTVNREDMEGCFVNLLVNAFEAVGCEGSAVTFRVREIPYATNRFSGFVDVIVEDDGPGIPQGIIDEVFTPFFTTKQGGMGLGLSLAYEAAKRNGAQLEIQSEEGKGTRVIVRLPYREASGKA